MLDKGILHGGDTLDAAREAKLERLEAQSCDADEAHQNATHKDLKSIKALFSDLYEENLGRPLSEAQISLHLSDEGFQFDFFEAKGTELFDTSQNPKTAGFLNLPVCKPLKKSRNPLMTYWSPLKMAKPSRGKTLPACANAETLRLPKTSLNRSGSMKG